MFIAIGYKFSSADREKLKVMLSGVERDLFLRYLEADLVCLEERKQSIPVRNNG